MAKKNEKKILMPQDYLCGTTGAVQKGKFLHTTLSLESKQMSALVDILVV